MNAPRIGIVGARRVRQGLGPFVARHLAAAGARVPAFLATSAESVAETEQQLAGAGLRATGYTDVGELLDREHLDALAILSPAETHERYLLAALEHGLHVLCEKPLLWGGGPLSARTASLVEGFAGRGLLLRENCQWPWTLPAYRELFPGPEGARGPEPVRSFAMRLSPASHGEAMLGDALPHPLSLLQTLHPDREARLEGLRYSSRDPAAEELEVTFRYGLPASGIEVRVELIHGERLPREAWYSINGRIARRRIRLDDYAMFLGGGEREVALADPLDSLLRAFLSDLEEARGGARPDSDSMISHRATLLDQARAAFRGEPS